MSGQTGAMPPKAAERTAWLVPPAGFEDDFYGQ